MYDIRPLEEQWKIYKKNQRKPYYIALVALCTLLVILFSFFSYKNSDFIASSDVLTPTKVIMNEDKVHSSILIDKQLSIIQVNEKETIEEESIQDIKPIVNIKVVEDITKIKIPTLPIVKDIPILDKIPKKKNIIYHKPKRIKKLNIEKPRKKMKLNIIESSSISAYKDVEKRFMRSHDTDDSLFLAKSYFRKRNYTKSEYWALETNKVNANIEESWLILVNAKIKLGKKNEAMRILTNYAKKSNSSAAWNLLLKLKK